MSLKFPKRTKSVLAFVFSVFIVIFAVYLLTLPLRELALSLVVSTVIVTSAAFAIGLFLYNASTWHRRINFSLLVVSHIEMFGGFSLLLITALILHLIIIVPEVDLVGYLTIGSFALAIAALIFPFLDKKEGDENIYLVKNAGLLSLFSAFLLFFFGLFLFIGNIGIANPAVNQTINQIQNSGIGSVQNISSVSNYLRVFGAAAFLVSSLNIVIAVLSLLVYFKETWLKE